ncbi:MAG: HD domain-containing phosphohydrolase [Gemmatimonadales bacterium]
MSESTSQQSPARVLVVDDDDALCDAVARFLEKSGYEVKAAPSGKEALAVLAEDEFDLMLLDIAMPEMSGIEVLPEALDVAPDLGILMLTGMRDATSAAICMQRGAIDYLTKPIELGDLDAALKRAIRRRDTLIQTREISSWLREELEHRTQELERERHKQQQIVVATLEALINALEAKNEFLAGHSARVAAFAAMIAHQLGLSDDEVELVRMAGRLHDLGKIGIREAVLNKPQPLSDEEYEHVKTHVEIGSAILAPLKHLGPIVDLVRSHHEHWDGSGYPDGLSGDDIPLGARIICAAEVYDALTTSRPYQEQLTPEAAVERMRELAGRVIDPHVMEALTRAVAARETLVFLDEDQQPVEP